MNVINYKPNELMKAEADLAALRAESERLEALLLPFKMKIKPIENEMKPLIREMKRLEIEIESSGLSDKEKARAKRRRAALKKELKPMNMLIDPLKRQRVPISAELSRCRVAIRRAMDEIIRIKVERATTTRGRIYALCSADIRIKHYMDAPAGIDAIMNYFGIDKATASEGYRAWRRSYVGYMVASSSS